jgi:hypothetical protein
MKFILLLSFVAFYCCTCKPTKQKRNIDTSELLNLLSQTSKFQDSALGDKLSDTFRKWFPVWDTVLANDTKHRADGNLHDSLEQQKKLDSINQHIVTGFLDKYGYPDRYQASSTGMYAIFIVIQHAPIVTQEKYYPIFLQAYKNGNFPGISIALLEDRINMHRHRKQYYGTQQGRYENEEFCLYPVVNPDSINAWRKQICVDDTTTRDYTIESEYKNMYKKEWDIEKYKKQLPDLIKKFNVTDSPSIRFVK